MLQYILVILNAESEIIAQQHNKYIKRKKKHSGNITKMTQKTRHLLYSNKKKKQQQQISNIYIIKPKTRYIHKNVCENEIS